MVPITFEYDAAVVEPQLLSRNMAMGHRTSCAIVENGSVACWGMGDNGQLGDGGQSNAIVPTLTNSMPGNMKAVAIDAPSSLVCAVLENGSVACWGSGFYGDLGNGVAFNYRQLPTLTLPIGAEAIDVATRTDGACALPCERFGFMLGQGHCWTIGQRPREWISKLNHSTFALAKLHKSTSERKEGDSDHGWLHSHLRPARRWERCLLGFKQRRTTRSWKHIRGSLSPNAHPFVGCSGDSH